MEIKRHKRKILEVSTIPQSAGIGGVTIYTQRLLESPQMDSDHFSISLFDYKSCGFITFIVTLLKFDIIHIHISNPIARFIYMIVAKCMFKTTLVTFHGNVGRHKSWLNYLDKITIKLCSIPIVINQDSFNIAYHINRDSQLISAFIPPVKQEPLSQTLLDQIAQLKSKYTKIFSTNASKMHYDVNGNEIYGITKIVELFKELKDMALIISDPSGDYKNYYSATPPHIIY